MSSKRVVAAEPGAAPPPQQTKVRAKRRPLLALAGDERLQRRAREGDGAALETIFRRYEQDLYRFCMGILGEPQDAQDALQNTMVKVLRALPGERREIKLKPWLYRVAHNEAIELRRRQRPAEPLEAETVAVGNSLEERAEGDERLRKLFEDMADLPERQRAALVMRELSGFEFGEIAAALDTSPGAVRQALYEARRGLGQMQMGREMRCAEVTRMLSDEGGPGGGARELRAHLRECADCRRFRAGIEERKRTLAAIAPLPAVVAVAMAKGALASGGSGVGGGAVAAGAGGGVLGGTLGGGGAVAGSLGASGLAKSVAGILAVVVIGTATADRSGLVQFGPERLGHRGGETPVAGVPSNSAGAEPRVESRASISEQRRHPTGTGAGARHRSPATVAGAAARGDYLSGSGPAGTGLIVAPAAAAHPEHGGKAATGEGEAAPQVEREAKAEQERPGHPAGGEGVGSVKNSADSEAARGAQAKNGAEAAPKEHPEHPEHPAHPERGAAEAPGAQSAPEAAAPPAHESASTETSERTEDPMRPTHPEQPQTASGARESTAAPAAEDEPAP